MSNVYFETKQVSLSQIGGATRWDQVSGEAAVSFPSNVISATAYIQAVELWNFHPYPIGSWDARITEVTWLGAVVKCFLSAALCPGLDSLSERDIAASYVRFVVVADCE